MGGVQSQGRNAGWSVLFPLHLPLHQGPAHSSKKLTPAPSIVVQAWYGEGEGGERTESSNRLATEIPPPCTHHAGLA